MNRETSESTELQSAETTVGKNTFSVQVRTASQEGFDSTPRTYPHTDIEHEGVSHLDPSTIEFWQEIRTDLETIPEQKITLLQFLKHYHPEKNKYGWRTNVTGKYFSPINSLPQHDTDESQGKVAEHFFRDTFIPPEDDEEFGEVVSDVRDLIGSKLKPPRETAEETLEKLSQESFWDELGADLASVEENVGFSWFLQYYNPGTSYNGSWSAGKYRNFYPRLTLAYREEIAKDNPADAINVSTKDIHKLIYNSAPEEVKLLLQSKFSRIFGELRKESIEKQELLPEEVRGLIDGSTWLRPDTRDDILDQAATYIHIKRQNDTSHLSQEAIKTILKEATDPERAEEPRKPVRNVSETISELESLTPLLQEMEVEDKTLATAATELVTSLDRGYYSPLFKSLLYKPAALFWSEYQRRFPDQVVSPQALVQFLKVHTEGKLALAAKENGTEDAFRHIQTDVLPDVYQQFEDIAGFAPQISYFKGKDASGKSTHLFLHQVEAIRNLMHDEGGIVADEPGTGKTLELALAALNLLDMRGVPSDRPGRIFVVGGKTTIDNWENELGIHIDNKDIQVANINFTGKVNASLAKRVAKIEAMMRSPQSAKQIILVNYDSFRNRQFQRMLTDYPADVIIVDETHNVKSRRMSALRAEEPSDTSGDSVARRVRSLYTYIRENQELSVFFATSTPYVKDLTEPLIMAHLVRPDLVSQEDIHTLRDDVVETNRMLRSVMLRRRKEEIADLPPKETTLVPIDLTSMSDESQEAFISLAEELSEVNETSFARFYSLLSLEGQAKYPWLVNKVNEIVADGRKVVIFTPFVSGKDRHTASISTQAIATRLYKEGITSVGVFDGSLSEEQRQIVQKDFHSKDGINVLVGNYMTAGESITLNSPENRATEVILFIAPNAISRYIQAVDRIHRYGQAEKVTIHIPYVTGDLLNRDDGTYDERVVQRLMKEYSTFSAVIDGLFFVESRDFYQDVVLKDKTKLTGNIAFTGQGKGTVSAGMNVEEELINFAPKVKPLPTETEPSRRGRGRLKTGELQEQEEVVLNATGEVDTPEYKAWLEEEFDPFKDTFAERQKAALDITYETEREGISALDALINQYPKGFDFSQERLLFEYMQQGKSLKELKKNPKFWEAVRESDRNKYDALFADSANISEVIINGNLRFVAWRAWKYIGRGLSYQDLFQEGVTGLMTARDRFDLEKSTNFGTYAYHWVNQAMQRAAQDQGRTIRLPVHIGDTVGRIRKVMDDNYLMYGEYPDDNTVYELLAESNLPQSQIAKALDIIHRGRDQVASLDRAISHDGDETYGQFVPDPTDLEEIVLGDYEESELQQEIQEALQILSTKDRMVIEKRFGLHNGKNTTLEEIGKELGVSRERVRQMEGKALDLLVEQEREKPRLRRWWERGLPQYAYHLSAEETAIRLGLFKDIVAPPQSVGKTHEIVYDASEERRRQLAVYEVGKLIFERASKEIGILEQLPPREQSMVKLYFMGSHSNKDTQLGRLATIFKLSSNEVEQTIVYSLESLDKQLVALTKDTKGKASGRTPVPTEQVVDLWNTGMNILQISKTVGRSSAVINKIVNRLLTDGAIEPHAEKRGRKRKNQHDKN